MFSVELTAEIVNEYVENVLGVVVGIDLYELLDELLVSSIISRDVCNVLDVV